ncbi:MAG: GNAT family N-acetyltransferase [Holosporaceae bacterium]|jgi:RimJ/RimL family protein N-acetyltransferase|nr:GNAT family N-acetyltransferase [Holosporaceae bacterium]
MILRGYDDFTKDVTLVSYSELVENIDLKNTYLKWLNDPSVVAPIMSEDLAVENKTMSFVDDSFKRFTSENCQGFFINFNRDDVFIGTIKLDSINQSNKSAEIGLMIGDRSYWGNKIGEKAVLVILKYAFENLLLNRCYGGTDESNGRMQNLFIKTGFVFEGKVREGVYFDGKYSDNYRYSILKKDYFHDKESRSVQRS